MLDVKQRPNSRREIHDGDTKLRQQRVKGTHVAKMIMRRCKIKN